MGWVKEIEVTLKVRKLRVGGGTGENVDLDTIPIKYTASSLRGLLRKSAIKVLKSLKPNLNAKDGNIFGKGNKEGKIQIVFEGVNGATKNYRYGIKIDSNTSSVMSGHLFSYTFYELEEVKFSIKPTIKLTKDEAKLLYYAINYLRFDSVGGFGSRGLGLIEDVEIDEEFRSFVEGGS